MTRGEAPPCPARLAWRNPYGRDIHAGCLREPHDPREPHRGRWLESDVTWRDGDRRCYQGEFPGWCERTPGCLLPAGHGGSGCAT